MDIKLTTTIVLLLLSLNTYADSTTHSHAGRVHAHQLPTQGVRHKHGNGQLGISSTQNKVTKKHVSRKPKVVDKNGDTPLIKAAWKGKHSLVKNLIKNGAAINHKDHAGQTALHLAARFRHFDIVKTLVNSGANINIQKNSGYTAVMAAINNKDSNIVNFLVQRKANLHLRAKDGQTALSIAQRNRDNRTIKLLKAHGVRSNSQSKTRSIASTRQQPSSPRKPQSRKSNSNIKVVNSNLPECRGITIHRAFVDKTPFYYGGSVVTTIPVYKIAITNKGKRRKVVFDIYYKQDFGNRKYGTKQPTGHYLKEFGPLTLRANTINKVVALEKPKGREVYERVELVECN